MKKLSTVLIFCNIWCINLSAQFNTYVRFTDYSDKVLNSSGSFENSIEYKGNSFDISSNQFIKVNSFKGDIEQVLNIGSQSTGAGAGKESFNPFHLIKSVDDVTPTLMQNSCSGTPFKTVEVYFVNNQNIIFTKYIYKLVAVKTMAWNTSCPNGCNSPVEDVSFEYGGQIILVYRPGTEGKAGAIQGGWNRVKNIVDNDLNSVVK